MPSIISAIFEQYKYRVTLRVSRKISSIASGVVCRGLKLDRDTRDSDNYGRYLNNKISCIASCVAHNIVCRFVFRVSPFERETRYCVRYSKRHTILCAIHEATHDILRDTRRDTRYLQRYISFWLPTQGRYFVVHCRASLRLSYKISCVASCVAQNIVYRFVCRGSPVMKEGGDY